MFHKKVDKSSENRYAAGMAAMVKPALFAEPSERDYLRRLRELLAAEKAHKHGDYRAARNQPDGGPCEAASG